jgi:hypothetical protein
MTHARLAFVLAGVVALTGRSLDACSCLPPDGLADPYARATLVAASPHPTDRCGDETLTFLPTRFWKGKAVGPVLLPNRSVGRHRDGTLPSLTERICLARCPMRVAVRKDYIVFAFGQDLHLQQCYGPLDTSQPGAADVLRELDALSARAVISGNGPANKQMQRTRPAQAMEPRR